MMFLKNKNRLPICICNACNVNEFDTTPINIFRNFKKSLIKSDFVFNCWGWILTRKANGGAIATVGSTGFTYLKWDEKAGGKTDAWSFILPRFLWEYNVNGTKKLGEIWSNVIKDYIKKFPINWNTPSIDYDASEPAPDAINAKTLQEFIIFGDPTLQIGGYKKEIFI
jgi:hypothetical protein